MAIKLVNGNCMRKRYCVCVCVRIGSVWLTLFQGSAIFQMFAMQYGNEGHLCIFYVCWLEPSHRLHIECTNEKKKNKYRLDGNKSLGQANGKPRLIAEGGSERANHRKSVAKRVAYGTGSFYIN